MKKIKTKKLSISIFALVLTCMQFTYPMEAFRKKLEQQKKLAAFRENLLLQKQETIKKELALLEKQRKEAPIAKKEVTAGAPSAALQTLQTSLNTIGGWIDGEVSAAKILEKTAEAIETANLTAKTDKAQAAQWVDINKRKLETREKKVTGVKKADAGAVIGSHRAIAEFLRK